MKKIHIFNSFICGGLITYCITYYYDKHQSKLIKYEQWDNNWDKKEEEYQQKQTKGIKTITIVRHGQYNEKKLTELGKQQAHVTAQRLKDLNMQFNCIYTSNLQRAKETAEIIQTYFPNIKVVVDEDLNEGFPCIVSPVRRGNERLNEKIKNNSKSQRIKNAFERYFQRLNKNEDEHDLFVIHGNVMRYFICRALQYPCEGWLRLQPLNCSISQLKISPQGFVTLFSMGDCGHLSKDQITNNMPTPAPSNLNKK